MIRKASVEDIQGIVALINQNLDTLLPRTCAEIEELIDTFWIAETSGEIIGCCCLEVYSAKIAELRSLAVRKDRRGNGIGKALVREVVQEAKRRNIPQLLAVSSQKDFFEHRNFGTCLNEKYAMFWNGLEEEEVRG